MSAAPTFAEVLRRYMVSCEYELDWGTLRGACGDTPVLLATRMLDLLDGAQPTPAEAVALATALNLSGGAWRDFLVASGVATEAGGGS